jgi:hypothetical protein
LNPGNGSARIPGFTIGGGLETGLIELRQAPSRIHEANRTILNGNCRRAPGVPYERDSSAALGFSPNRPQQRTSRITPAIIAIHRPRENDQGT